MIRSNPHNNQQPRTSTSIQALRMVAHGQGDGTARRILTGYSALVARNLPFTALQFPLFEALRRALWERRDGAAVVRDGAGGVGGGERRVESGRVARGLLDTGKVNGASAAVSGAVAAVVTTPMDVVKTRMMLGAGAERGQGEGTAGADKGRSGAGKEGGPPKSRSLSGAQVARVVYQESGVKGLFRGGLLRAGWTAIGSGLYLGTYEVAKVWLKGTAEDDGV